MKKKNGAKLLQSKKMYFVAAEMQKKNIHSIEIFVIYVVNL